MKSHFTIFCFLLLFLVSTFTDSFAQTNWTKYLENPVLPRGPAGAWDAEFVSIPSVLFDGSTYHMWYSNAVNEDFDRIGYATSADGIAWTKYDDPATTNPPFAESDPVLNPGSQGAWDDERATAPSVLLIDTTYHMWYTGSNLPLTDKPAGIGHASSTDGINWVKDTLNNPVLIAGVSGTWDDEWIFGNSVLFDGSDFHLYYMAWNGVAEQIRIGHATSPDGVTWTKDQNNPVLSGETWDSPRVDVPNVVFDGTTYHMWYSGGKWYRWRIGYATSPDGSEWTKYEDNPVLDWGAAGSWEDYCLVSCPVLLDTLTNTFKMWYSGADAFWSNQIGYAVDFSNIAHSDSLGFSTTYFQPNVDTLKIKARIVNPDEHTLTATAQIVGEDSTIVDSTDLTDKGDGIWSGKWPVPEGERMYHVGIKTIDEETGTIHDGIMWSIEEFTTIGPVAFDDYTITSDEDTIPNPGDRLVFEISLKNESVTDTVINITAKTISLDTCALIIGFDRNYNDIAPGEVAEPNRGITILFDENCPAQTGIDFALDIYSDGYHFWSDTFTVFVDSIVSSIKKMESKKPTKYALNKNFPNPFNPTTTIEYQLPYVSDVKLSIYNLLGQRVVTLVSEKQKAGYHQVEWNASGFASGVYYYRIEAGEFQDVKKMILLR